MDNKSYIDMLKNSVADWNKWRSENRATQIDLNGTDLFEFDLRNADLRGANLKNAQLNNADLRGANLIDSDLSGAVLSGADLNDSLFFATNLNNADLSKVVLIRGNLSKASCRNTNFDRANLAGVDFHDADLTSANLTEASLSSTQFNNTSLNKTNFYEARMGSTTFIKCDLSKAIALEKVLHAAPSNIGIGTIYKSKAKLPHKFLRGAGIPANFIENMTALAGKAIEFYSCFISYNETDNAISEKLFYDLQAVDIRVWRWRENARTGEFMDVEINRAIRLHDKLIVICSGNSLNAEPVIAEIREAIEKEKNFRKIGNPKTVLFPIRIDDYVFSWDHKLSKHILSRFIGDFRNWTDPKAYKKAFDKLVQDLNKQQSE